MYIPPKLPYIITIQLIINWNIFLKSKNQRRNYKEIKYYNREVIKQEDKVFRKENIKQMFDYFLENNFKENPVCEYVLG